MSKYIAIIRVFENGTTISRQVYDCQSKEEVKNKLLEEYSDLFPNGKVFQKRGKNEFVYCLIYELSDYWENYWLSPIKCKICGKETNALTMANVGIHSDYCSHKCKNKAEELSVIETNSSKDIYIYKITQKSTNKCYIGKTKNHFIWRWWEHLKANTGTKFHEFLKDCSVDDLLFEVIEVLPQGTENKDVFLKESEYIKKYNSIQNGFNSLISNNEVFAYYDYFEEIMEI